MTDILIFCLEYQPVTVIDQKEIQATGDTLQQQIKDLNCGKHCGCVEYLQLLVTEIFLNSFVKQSLINF